ncbi:MAG: SIMPL domain-containing protein [Candidatus Acidiferrales bacterium]
MNSSFRSALAIAISIVLASTIGSWAFLSGKKLNQTIEVTGSAKKRIKSDLIIWQVSVETESASLPEAYTKLIRDVDKTKAFLVSHGVPENVIAISAVDTTPIRPPSRPNYSENGPQQTFAGAVLGYHLKQSLSVRSSEVDKITAVSRQVTELVNQGLLLTSEAPEYLYTHLAETKVEILASAARDAKERAQQIASSTGSRIGEIREASMGVLQITAADSVDVSGMGENDTKSLDKDITAVVHVTFAID